MKVMMKAFVRCFYNNNMASFIPSTRQMTLLVTQKTTSNLFSHALISYEIPHMLETFGNQVEVVKISKLNQAVGLEQHLGLYLLWPGLQQGHGQLRGTEGGHVMQLDPLGLH